MKSLSKIQNYYKIPPKSVFVIKKMTESIDEISKALEQNGDGFIKAMWCGDEACEDKVKELTGAGSRCIPFEQENINDKCVCCGEPAKHMVLWGNAY